MPTELFTQDACVSGTPQGIENMSSERLPRSTNKRNLFLNRICRFQNPDIPRAGRVGAPGGAARRSRAGLNANKTVRLENKSSLVPSKASKKRRLNVSREARKSEIQCKPNAETKSPVDNRIILGISAAHQRDREHSFFLAADQLSESWKTAPRKTN